MPLLSLIFGRKKAQNAQKESGSFLRLLRFFAASAFVVLGPALARAAEPVAKVIKEFCIDCHDSDKKKGDLVLEGLDPAKAAANPKLWENVVHKLNHRQMPPIGEGRPKDAEYNAAIAQLTALLDGAAAQAPNPGRTDTIRRLTRTEYQNAIRDLLGVEIDATALLPQDEPALGFDNVTLGNLTPTLLDRYVSAAQKIARLAVGGVSKVPGGDTFRVRPDVTQEEHIAGLPLGTRGGTLIPYIFPQDGEYEIQVRLARDRNEQVEGLRRPHEVEVLLDRERVGLFTVRPPGADKNADIVDQHLKLRLAVKAGPHDLGVTFPKNPSALIETERQPFLVRFNVHRHPRTVPAIYQVSILGPFNPKGAGDTPSRRLIFGDAATAEKRVPAATEAERAKQILAKLMRRAYRRPVTDDDLARPLQFFRDGAAEGAGFEAGIENALSAILVSPRFLLRVEKDPADAKPGTVYRISDLELASRLSFFLWSSIPDDALLDAAVRGDLRQPKLLEQQVRRMLADERARSLVTNFASQWLHLRALESVTPDLRLFIDFDDNIRQALRQETELFVESIVREDRSITDLVSANFTFLNERLAKHYGIPSIYGSHFRRVELTGDAARQRGGLLRQGSVLTVTSYATRTSPVLRGKWILDNLLASPPPPPPPNVPSLDDNVIAASLPMRARLSEHRKNPNCSSCHNVMDPPGFALENFDAIGRWRALEDHKPIDNSGGLADGSTFTGVEGLERALLQRPELFAGALTEKLLIFALGRGVESYDAPAIRHVVRQAQADHYRFSALVLGIVNSTPFQMRKTP
jgi:mono/diheme cytochrome c family protein